MGRSPCCEKMGLKKGAWSGEEDQILVSYIQKHGHSNWRALPKLAGLMRCGKSCRLRWTNYLKPDIKRGNFSKEEEDTIIELHRVLGNRWSTIASKLPGRTDNEIKNIWHTHLKKRLQNYQTTPQDFAKPKTKSPSEKQTISPEPSSSEFSTVTETAVDSFDIIKPEQLDYSPETFLDDSFWSEALSSEENCMMESSLTADKLGLDFQKSPVIDDGMEFWYNIFVRDKELLELVEI